MAQPAVPTAPRGRLQNTFAGVGLAVLFVAVLFFAQTIFIPVALAVFLTFLMAPVVERLEKSLGRPIAVVATVSRPLGLLVGTGWVVSREVTGLVETLKSQPKYTQEH